MSLGLLTAPPVLGSRPRFLCQAKSHALHSVMEPLSTPRRATHDSLSCPHRQGPRAPTQATSTHHSPHTHSGGCDLSSWKVQA